MFLRAIRYTCHHIPNLFAKMLTHPLPQFFPFGILCCILIGFSSQALAVIDGKESFSSGNDQLKLSAIARSPDQTASFYEGRGFETNALSVIKQACFITIGMRNTTGSILWVKPAEWDYFSDGKKIPRLTENDWRQQWESIKMPLAHQSTFSWTLFPESRDLQPDEPVGGNITLPLIATPIDIVLHFSQDNAKFDVTIPNISCKEKQ